MLYNYYRVLKKKQPSTCLPPQPPTSMLWSEVPSIINRNGCFYWRPPSTKFSRHHWIGGPGGHEEPGMLYYVIFCSAGNQKINLPLRMASTTHWWWFWGCFFVGFTTVYYITGQSMSIDILSASRQPAIWSFGWTVRLFNKFLRPWTNPTICRGFITMDGYISQELRASVPTPHR